MATSSASSWCRLAQADNRAFACYADEHATGQHDAYGVMVFALRGDKIAGITGFPQDNELFKQLGAPLVLAA